VSLARQTAPRHEAIYIQRSCMRRVRTVDLTLTRFVPRIRSHLLKILKESSERRRGTSRKNFLLLLLLLLFIGPYPVYFIQRTCSPAKLMSNFRNNLLKAVQMARYSLFHFLRLLQAAYLVYMVSRFWSTSCDILNLADVADVFVANSIPRSVASNNVLISVVHEFSSVKHENSSRYQNRENKNIEAFHKRQLIPLHDPVHASDDYIYVYMSSA